MLNTFSALVDPQEDVTSKVIFFGPGVEKITGPGSKLEEVEGVPPSNVHL